MNTVGSHYKRPPSIWSIDFRFPANCATLNMDPLETQLPFRGSWSLASSSSKCLPFFCSIRDVLTNTWQFWTLPVWEGEEDVCVERVSLHTRDLLRDQQIHGSMCTAMIHEFHKNTFSSNQGWTRTPLIQYFYGPRLERGNSYFRDCFPPQKVLALGLYRLAHRNSYSTTIAPVFIVQKSTVIEAMQDMVNAPYDLRFFVVYASRIIYSCR